MIITLAGHVDHGKTSLVRALTGTDTDRLAEEKRRGLTIDLGFAYLETDRGTLGFVDVPGHHRFIHNMVAGVSSMQHALLVIAADDGPMPQSREHLQILDLLGIEHGTVALTKCDRVSPERRIAAIAEIEQLVQGTFLEGAAVIETSAETGEGLETLRDRLTDIEEQSAAGSTDEAFRLPIDRAFTISGAGVVVTGTVHSGSVATDQNLILFPDNLPLRVKSVRAQNKSVDTAQSGDRCALNLTGVAIEDVQRGQWLARQADSRSTQFTIRLKVLADFPRSVRHWLPVHVYHATTHTIGHVALLTEERIGPGEERLIELVTENPLLLRRGDRVIVRDQGLDRTLGGGGVISTLPASGRRRDATRLRRLSADDAGSASIAIQAHLALGEVDVEAFQNNWALTTEKLDELLARENCDVIDGYAISRAVRVGWSEQLLEEIKTAHSTDQALQGLKQSEIGAAIPDRYLSHLLNDLVSAAQLTTRAGRYLPAAHQVALSDAEQKLYDQVLPHLDQLQPPSLGDLGKVFRASSGDLAKRLHPLVTKKYLIRISDTRYYLPQHLQRMSDIARQLADTGPFTVRQYRDAAEIGRNVAIEVLEHFDRGGFTRRDGDLRQVVGDPSRAGA